MAEAVASLKSELKHFQDAFPKTSSIFAVRNYTLDEVTCVFFSEAKKKHVINCTISEFYPSSKPMWYSESEDRTVVQVIEQLSDIECSTKYVILEMAKYLVTELCKKFNIAVPSQIKTLDQTPSQLPIEISDDDSYCSEDEDDDDLNDVDDIVLEESVNAEIKEAASENSEISAENLAVLHKIKQTQQKNYLEGVVSGSVQASDRLMKELRAIYRSDSFKKGCYSVELVNDSLYDWHVEILTVDPDSTLDADLKKLKASGEPSSIVMGFTFRDNFPFDPPFVRVVCPVLSGGFVLNGGAICMELLTRQGWSSAYSIESLIMQIMATLVKGNARVHFGAPKSSYTLSRAQQSFKRLVKIHEKNGWFTPPKQDG